MDNWEFKGSRAHWMATGAGQLLFTASAGSGVFELWTCPQQSIRSATLSFLRGVKRCVWEMKFFCGRGAGRNADGSDIV